MKYRPLLILALLLCGCGNGQIALSPINPSAAVNETDPSALYSVHFSAVFTQDKPTAIAAITLHQKNGEVHALDFNAPAERYRVVDYNGAIKVSERRILWSPPADGGRMTYAYDIDQVRGNAYDARHTPNWVMLRLDDLFPPAKVLSRKGARSRSSVSITGPDGWSFESRFSTLGNITRAVTPGTHKFTRPTGWLIGGKLGTRRDMLNGRHVVVSAPVGSGVRRQDTLAFLHWIMPELSRVFPSLPAHILVAGAPREMWRGGLSAPGSLYLHADRPLISENGTSTLLHELIHLAGLHSGAPGADWIIEGLPEYYSMLILKRSGGISTNRFQRTLAQLARWSKSEGGTLTDPSKGADTAAAVLVFHDLAGELRQAGSHIDELTARLLQGNEISIERLVEETGKILGKPSQVLIKALQSAPK